MIYPWAPIPRWCCRQGRLEEKKAKALHTCFSRCYGQSRRNRAQQHCPAIISLKWGEKLLLVVLSSAVSCHFHVTPLSHSCALFPVQRFLTWSRSLEQARNLLNSLPTAHVRLLISIAARPESVTLFSPPSFPGILLMVPKFSHRIFPTAFRQFEKQWRSQSIFYNPRCGNWSLTSLKSSWELFTGWMSSAWIYPASHSAWKALLGKTLSLGHHNETTEVMATLCVPQVQFSGLFMHKYQEWMSQLVQVLLTMPLRYSSPARSTSLPLKPWSRLSFTCAAQKPHKPSKPPKRWGAFSQWNGLCFRIIHWDT